MKYKIKCKFENRIAIKENSPFRRTFKDQDENVKTEFNSLAWGDIHGSLSIEKIEEWAEELIDENDENGEGDFDEDLLEMLIQRKLVFEVTVVGLDRA